jgi:hypothetical protein
MARANEIERFNKWSAEWKDGRKAIDAARILRLWQQPMPRGWEREIWNGKLGYRKRSDNRGEQRIENILFDKSKVFRITFAGRETVVDYRVDAIYHNMPLANMRRGQVIADAFGVLKIGKRVRPLFIEVKVAANDPWFAFVENLQQIRLARSCAQKIQDFVHRKTEDRVDRGVWGLILASDSYYKKHDSRMDECKVLLGVLRRSTRARVAFGMSDSLANGQIKITANNWFDGGLT